MAIVLMQLYTEEQILELEDFILNKLQYPYTVLQLASRTGKVSQEQSQTGMRQIREVARWIRDLRSRAPLRR